MKWSSFHSKGAGMVYRKLHRYFDMQPVADSRVSLRVTWLARVPGLRMSHLRLRIRQLIELRCQDTAAFGLLNFDLPGTESCVAPAFWFKLEHNGGLKLM